MNRSRHAATGDQLDQISHLLATRNARGPRAETIRAAYAEDALSAAAARDAISWLGHQSELEPSGDALLADLLADLLALVPGFADTGSPAYLSLTAGAGWPAPGLVMCQNTLR